MGASFIAHHDSQTGEEGFTLLEALVAIALMAGALTAIFSLVGTILNSAHQVGRSNDAVEIKLNALAAMTTINPMLQQTGEMDLGPYHMEWKSVPITRPIDGSGYPSGLSLYRVALYESTVAVTSTSGSPLIEFKLRQVGYERVREAFGPQIANPNR